MKIKFKRVLSMVLIFCILLGMVSSYDVNATNSTNTVSTASREEDHESEIEEESKTEEKVELEENLALNQEGNSDGDINSERIHEGSDLDQLKDADPMEVEVNENIIEESWGPEESEEGF
ncbi:MAG TPA: hypothetical protein IAC41_04100, partial [Candidatus Merdenecus merdavium]|nr:hypothetical protein [Candidatus Merdenecus merdavium]